MIKTASIRTRATVQRLHPFRSNRTWLVAVGILLASAAVLPSLLNNRASISSGDAIPNPPGMETTQEQNDAQARRDVSKAVAAVAFPNRLRGAVNGSGLSELSAVLMSFTQPMKVRRQAAWRIAKIGSAEAFTVLRKALLTAPPMLQPTITEALGQFGHEGSKTVLEPVVDNPDESVARAAVRGLAALPAGFSVSTLLEVLRNPSRSETIRAEAALALGSVAGAVEAIPTLVETALYSESADLVKSSIIALGGQPFSQTEDFFRLFMEPANTDVDLRTLALESLSRSDQAKDFVLSFLDAEEAEIRAAAAWALATMENPGEIAVPLSARLAIERDPEVRTRLYQAMETQIDLDLAPLVMAALAESHTSTRIAAMNLVASRIGAIDDPVISQQFDRQIVPWLAKQALNGSDLQARMSSVLALRAANTPAASAWLEAIVIRSRDPKLAQAARR